MTASGCASARSISAVISRIRRPICSWLKRLSKIDHSHGTGGNYLFYLATPPQMFSPIVQQLGAAGLAGEQNGHWRRVIVEKPFGTDLNSAQALNKRAESVLDERQIYRIDHYLGKETVQNILVFRFANGMFEPLWNRNHIDHVQITVAETVGVETARQVLRRDGRARDMIPNHLFQLLTLTAMEPPTCFDADAVRSEKARCWKRSTISTPRCAVQCGAGAIWPRDDRGRAGDRLSRDGQCEPALDDGNLCRDEADDRQLAVGRRADLSADRQEPRRRRTEMVIQFKQAPLTLFRDTPVERLAPTISTLHIQPEESVTLQFDAKIPGPDMQIGAVKMKFDYRDYFQVAPNTGYETLIHDCMTGDATLFMRADEVEAGWRVIEPLLDAWRNDRSTSCRSIRRGAAGRRKRQRSWPPTAGGGARSNSTGPAGEAWR